MDSLAMKMIDGHSVVWATNGHVYFSRALHDRMPERMQGVFHFCKNWREFESLISMIAPLNEKEPA